MPKVFGIGLNRTGTTTLGRAFEILGYSHVGCRAELLRQYRLAGDLTGIHRVVERHESFEDWPWPLLYEELDAAYPGSRFILTLRASPERWLASLQQHALRTEPFNNCRLLAYGHEYPHGYEQQHLTYYRAHARRVRHHFRDRPGALLELCWERGDGWKELCTFLGAPVPDVPLPHLEASADATNSKATQLANRVASLLLRPAVSRATLGVSRVVARVVPPPILGVGRVLQRARRAADRSPGTLQTR